MSKRIFFVFILLSSIFYSCSKETTDHNHKSDQKVEKVESYYTCSMHPQVKEKGPGKCPICHMNLVKVEMSAEDEEGERTSQKESWRCKDYPDVTSEKEDLCPIDGTPMIKMESGNLASEIVAKVKLRKSQLEHFKPSFFPVSKMKMSKTIRLLGTVLQSEERESNIPARIGGRVEKVYIKSTGSYVKVMDPVVDIYSPQLITAGEEYLLAKKSFQEKGTPEFKEMLAQSQERLKLWGVKESQLESWYSSKKIPRNITLYSPVSGIVRKKHAVVGKYFTEGQNFLELSDLSALWVEMDVYEQEASLVKLGQKVELEFISLPGEKTEGEIDFIDPVLNANSRTLKVRTTIKNESGKLKPGMVADASLKIDVEGIPLVIPRSAIIDTGKRKVVWSKMGGKSYQAKTILTGYESEGYVEVKDGLMEGEEVVIEGNFLLDAQAQLFGGYEDFKKTNSEHQH